MGSFVRKQLTPWYSLHTTWLMALVVPVVAICSTVGDNPKNSLSYGSFWLNSKDPSSRSNRQKMDRAVLVGWALAGVIVKKPEKQMKFLLKNYILLLHSSLKFEKKYIEIIMYPLIRTLYCSICLIFIPTTNIVLLYC